MIHDPLEEVENEARRGKGPFNRGVGGVPCRRLPSRLSATTASSGRSGGARPMGGLSAGSGQPGPGSAGAAAPRRAAPGPRSLRSFPSELLVGRTDSTRPPRNRRNGRWALARGRRSRVGRPRAGRLAGPCRARLSPPPGPPAVFADGGRSETGSGGKSAREISHRGKSAREISRCGGPRGNFPAGSCGRFPALGDFPAKSMPRVPFRFPVTDASAPCCCPLSAEKRFGRAGSAGSESGLRKRCQRHPRSSLKNRSVREISRKNRPALPARFCCGLRLLAFPPSPPTAVFACGGRTR